MRGGGPNWLGPRPAPSMAAQGAPVPLGSPPTASPPKRTARPALAAGPSTDPLRSSTWSEEILATGVMAGAGWGLSCRRGA